MKNEADQRNTFSLRRSEAKGLHLGWWVAIAFWLVVIFMFSAQDRDLSVGFSQGIVQSVFSTFGLSGGDEWLPNFVIRKTAHAVEYSIFALLLFKALEGFSVLKATGRRYAVALAVLFCCAGLDEFHQTFLAGRTGQFSDVLLDTGAAAVVLGVVLLVAYLVRRIRA